MLDRAKLLHAINQVSDHIFLDLSQELELAKNLWEGIVSDPMFAQKVQNAQSQLLIPSFQGSLNALHHLTPYKNPYCVLSVDGSQIYPDRHQGTSCYLINIGSVILRYGIAGKAAELSSQPFVYAEEEIDELVVSADLVDCRRQELEFEKAFLLAQGIKKEQQSMPFLTLFDGSLIFWHLQTKEDKVKDYFLHRYLQILDQFYHEKILIAGYISLPKSKELVNLLRLKLCNFNTNQCNDFHNLDHLVDTSIVRFFLQPQQCSGIFTNQSPITRFYPDHLKPCFLYADVGEEIIRIEIPAWIAYDKERLESLVAMIMDQVNKGHGYPIAIAEAHEQAVVKGADRELFYHLVQKLNFDYKKNVSISQKLYKKRRIAF